MTLPADSLSVATGWHMSRRSVVQASALLAGAQISAPVAAQQAALPAPTPRPADVPTRGAAAHLPVVLQVNGQAYAIRVDPRTTVLDALRETLGLKGSKKGCDHGQCGACTVLIDGRRTNSCLTLAVMHDGQAITTIEGLSNGDVLHPMQQAFLKHDGFQCGYCTPGQICSALGMLTEAARGMPSHVTRALESTTNPLTDEEIRERMSGNLCRCSAYPNIVAAIREVAGVRA